MPGTRFLHPWGLSNLSRPGPCPRTCVSCARPWPERLCPVLCCSCDLTSGGQKHTPGSDTPHPCASESWTFFRIKHLKKKDTEMLELLMQVSPPEDWRWSRGPCHSTFTQSQELPLPLAMFTECWRKGRLLGFGGGVQGFSHLGRGQARLPLAAGAWLRRTGPTCFFAGFFAGVGVGGVYLSGHLQQQFSSISEMSANKRE